jgi:hypothetical protein
LNDEISSARRRLIRDALIYTPVSLGALAAWGATLASIVRSGGGPGIGLLVVLTVAVLLVGFQSIQSLRDLVATPVTSEGEVLRKWRRLELLFFPAYYIYVNRNVFRIPILFYHQVERGDVVNITHYPHTATVIAVKRLSRGSGGN